MFSVIFHPDVAVEVKASFNWYQEQSLGLGHEFVHEIEESIASIQSLPAAWSKMGQTHRRFVLSRFPYSKCDLRMRMVVSILRCLHYACNGEPEC